MDQNGDKYGHRDQVDVAVGSGVHMPRRPAPKGFPLANLTLNISSSLLPSYGKNINSTLGTHRAKCYAIFLCACGIPPLVVKKYQQAFLAPLPRRATVVEPPKL